MDPVLFFILGLVGWGVIIFGLSVAERLTYYWRTQKKVEQLDSKIWALESGAERVNYDDDHGWLNLVILAKDINFRVLWRAKRVTTEIHHQYKAYNFTYAPLYNLISGRTRGVIIQFKEDIAAPDFAMVRKGVRLKREEGHEYLALSAYSQLPDGLEFVGQPNDSRKIYDYLQTTDFFREIIDHPCWERLYIRDNFVGLYFRIDSGDDKSIQKQLFGIDEQVARIVLGEDYEVTDPAAEIRLLKEDESAQNSDS